MVQNRVFILMQIFCQIKSELVPLLVYIRVIERIHPLILHLHIPHFPQRNLVVCTCIEMNYDQQICKQTYQSFMFKPF